MTSSGRSLAALAALLLILRGRMSATFAKSAKKLGVPEVPGQSDGRGKPALPSAS
jgi:hypothetical protein